MSLWASQLKRFIGRIGVWESDQVEGHVLICVATHEWIASCGSRVRRRRVECPANCYAVLSPTSPRRSARSSNVHYPHSTRLNFKGKSCHKLRIHKYFTICANATNFTQRTLRPISQTDRNHIGVNINYALQRYDTNYKCLRNKNDS